MNNSVFKNFYGFRCHSGIIYNYSSTYNSNDIANELNCYFSNIANELALKLPKTQHPLASYAKQAYESLNLDFSFKEVDENEVLTTINSLNEKKAAGFDGLSCKTIKKLVKVLSFNMVTLFEAHIYEPSANH